MTYHLENELEAAHAIADIASAHLDVADFHWFIVTLAEAVSGKLFVNFTIPKGNDLQEYRGIIKAATLDVNCEGNSTINFSIRTNDNCTETLSFTFATTKTEENRNSKPGNFMKYYLRNDDSDVLVSIVVKYS